MQMKRTILSLLAAAAAAAAVAAPGEGSSPLRTTDDGRRTTAETALPAESSSAVKTGAGSAGTGGPAGYTVADATGNAAVSGETAPAGSAAAKRPKSAAPRKEQRFLPTRRRIDREIDRLKFAYKGEVIMGLTASYGTLSSDDTDILLIIDQIDADGSVATIKPFFGYFYRDNNCVGVRFGYRHMNGTVDNLNFDMGPSNDVSGSLNYLDLKSNNYSFGIFHRSYAGLDSRGRFGLFAEFELSMSTGDSDFTYETGGERRITRSENTQLKLAFNPGAAVYIVPNVCATLSFGLGGIQYTSVTQKDAKGNKIGSRKASNMRFRLNIAAINVGLTFHLWDKKKQ